MTLAVVFVLGLGATVLSMWAIIDAGMRPARVWRQAQVSKGLTTTLIVVTCALGALWYLLVIRPRLIDMGGPR